MLRNPVWLIVGVVQPLFYLLLFAPLLKPALARRPSAEAYKLFVPGLLVLLAMFGSLFTGFGLIAELRAGVIERMPGHPGQPARPAARPLAARRRVAAVPGGADHRSSRSRSACVSASATCCWRSCCWR